MWRVQSQVLDLDPRLADTRDIASADQRMIFGVRPQITDNVRPARAARSWKTGPTAPRPEDPQKPPLHPKPLARSSPRQKLDRFPRATATPKIAAPAGQIATDCRGMVARGEQALGELGWNITPLRCQQPGPRRKAVPQTRLPHRPRQCVQCKVAGRPWVLSAKWVRQIDHGGKVITASCSLPAAPLTLGNGPRRWPPPPPPPPSGARKEHPSCAARADVSKTL